MILLMKSQTSNQHDSIDIIKLANKHNEKYADIRMVPNISHKYQRRFIEDLTIDRRKKTDFNTLIKIIFTD